MDFPDDFGAFDDLNMVEPAPFPDYPDIESYVSERLEGLAKCCKIKKSSYKGNPVYEIDWPAQSTDRNEPIKLPTVIKCKPPKSQWHLDHGDELHIILFSTGGAEGTTGPTRLYCAYYEGCRTLDHLANVSRDNEFTPWPTLAACMKCLYGNYRDAWKNMICLANDSYYSGKPLSLMKHVGFENTNNLCARFDDVSKTELCQRAEEQMQHYLELTKPVKSPKPTVESPKRKKSKKVTPEELLSGLPKVAEVQEKPLVQQQPLVKEVEQVIEQVAADYVFDAMDIEFDSSEDFEPTVKKVPVDVRETFKRSGVQEASDIGALSPNHQRMLDERLK